jgi:hypothetical protein
MPEVVIDYTPRTYFRPYHDRHQRFACIVAHRRAGKTVACIHDMQKRALLCDRPRPRVAYIAPLLKQGKAVAWDHLKAAAAPFLAHGAQFNEAELRVDYPNGAQIRIYGADNPDSLRGIYLDGAVIDEPAQVDPRLFSEILLPALSDRQGWATFIGTPKGRDGFYQTWVTANANRHEWFTLRLKASETKAVPIEEIERNRSIQSASQFAREWECSFDEPDVDQFIPSTLVDEATKRQALPMGPKVLGLDVARHGDDRTVALVRNGDVVDDIDITVWRGLDTMQTVGRVIQIITDRKPDAIFVDGVGVGGGVVDRLRQLGYRCIDVNGGHTASDDYRYANHRAEMWAKMKEWLAKGRIPAKDELANDLSAPTYSFDARNRLKIEKKEDMKARGLPSPDLADALALTFAQPVATKDVQQVRLKWGNGASEADDYCPLTDF